MKMMILFASLFAVFQAAAAEELPPRMTLELIEESEIRSMNLSKDFQAAVPNQVTQLGDKGHGGDGLVKPNGTVTLLDLAEVDELRYVKIKDYIYDGDEASRSAHYARLNSILREFNFHSHNVSLKFQSSVFRDTMKTCLSLEGNESAGFYQPSAKNLKWAFTNQALEEVNDEGAIRIIDPITKKQLAIQSNGLVVVNEPLFQAMDSKNRFGLVLHEAGICAEKVLNPSLIQTLGTAPIRRYVRSLISWMDLENEENYMNLKVAYGELKNRKELRVDSFKVKSESNKMCSIEIYDREEKSPLTFFSCENYDAKSFAFRGVFKFSTAADLISYVTADRLWSGRFVAVMESKMLSKFADFEKLWKERNQKGN